MKFTPEELQKIKSIEVVMDGNYISIDTMLRIESIKTSLEIKYVVPSIQKYREAVARRISTNEPSIYLRISQAFEREVSDQSRILHLSILDALKIEIKTWTKSNLKYLREGDARYQKILLALDANQQAERSKVNMEEIQLISVIQSMIQYLKENSDKFLELRKLISENPEPSVNIENWVYDFAFNSYEVEEEDIITSAFSKKDMITLNLLEFRESEQVSSLLKQLMEAIHGNCDVRNSRMFYVNNQ